MMRNRYLTLIIVFAIVVTPLLSSSTVSISTSNLDQFSNTLSDPPEAYVIEGVPHVGQDGAYCAYASITMIFQYYGINTTEHEVLYNSGAGHSYAYKTELNCIHLSFNPNEREFLASLYVLSFDHWKADADTLSAEECWQEYWYRVKQNISQDIPICTIVNPFLMPSSKDFVGIPMWLSNLLSRWNIVLPASHAIIIVGYNETNGTVCYNDPATGLWNDDAGGTYVWMNQTEFKLAVDKTSSLGSGYVISRFIDTPSDPLNKSEVFARAHQRNIERMRGNKSVYAEKFSKFSLGINGLKELRNDLNTVKGRLPTIIEYKIRGSLYRVLKRTFRTVEMWRATLMSQFEYAPYVKRHVSQYLYENSNISELCEFEARLLEREAENWSKLDDYFLEFEHVRFFNLLIPRIIIHNMVETLDNIIAIEEAIIKGPVET